MLLETNSITVPTIYLIIPKLFRACTVPGNDQAQIRLLFISWYGELVPVYFEFINTSNQTEKWNLVDCEESFYEMVYNFYDNQQGASPIQRHSENCFMEISYIMK